MTTWLEQFLSLSTVTLSGCVGPGTFTSYIATCRGSLGKDLVSKMLVVSLRSIEFRFLDVLRIEGGDLMTSTWTPACLYYPLIYSTLLNSDSISRLPFYWLAFIISRWVLIPVRVLFLEGYLTGDKKGPFYLTFLLGSIFYISTPVDLDWLFWWGLVSTWLTWKKGESVVLMSVWSALFASLRRSLMYFRASLYWLRVSPNPK